jgi:hypothetical protein
MGRIGACVGVGAGALALWAGACLPDRERPAPGPSGPSEALPTVEIVQPRTNDVVPTPGSLLIAVRVENTFRLLDRVSVRVVRFADRTELARRDRFFDPPAGDTTVSLVVALDALPTNTQLNLTAEAEVGDLVVVSSEVAVGTLDCSRPAVFCP